MKKILIVIVSLFIFGCAASGDVPQTNVNTDTATRSTPSTQVNCVLGNETVDNCKVN